MTKNPVYIAHEKYNPIGIMLHTIGCPQPSAKVLIHNWNQENFTNGCPHAFVDAGKEQTVYQTLPWEIKGNHANGFGDDYYVGIVLCEPRGIRYTGKYQFDVTKKENVTRGITNTYETAVQLCAKLCILYGFDPLQNIISYDETTYSRIGYRNKSPEHLWTGANTEYTMNRFREDVKAKIADEMAKHPVDYTEISPDPIAENNEDEVNSAARSFPYNRTIRVDVRNLRIRKGPGKEYDPTGSYTGVGEFQIIDCQNGSGSEKGWGLLADNSGWVSLDFATLV